MKSAIFTIAALLCFTMAAMAQYGGWDKKLYVGGVANYGKSWLDNLEGGQSKRSVGGGISVIAERSRVWAWGANLTLDSRGYRTVREGNESTVTPLYLRLPVRGYYFLFQGPVRPMLYFGPEVGVKVAERTGGVSMVGDGANRGQKQAARWDAGINAGGGLNIQFIRDTWINLSVDYYRGFVDVAQYTGGSFNEGRNLGGSIAILHSIR